jgi:hypothetical protein
MKPGFNKVKTEIDHKVVINGRLNTFDLAKLQSDTDCTSLAIRNLKLDSLSCLQPLTKLGRLEIYACSIADYGAILKCESIRSLFLSGLGNIDLSFIGKIPALTELSLLYLRHFNALPDLSACKQLSTVTLWNCKQLCDIEALKKLPKLEFLRVVDVPLSPGQLEFVMKKSSVTTIAAKFGSTKLNEEFAALMKKYDKRLQ